MADLREEIEKRRTFAIISHPDAGKTTLTEKFLLYGGAINLAGSVKGKATARHAVSDWMAIEKERGISVIYITHDLGVVAKVADFVNVMYAGKIVETGTIYDIYYEPRHPYTWGLLSAMPDLDTDDNRLYTIPGSPPNLLYEPPGDAFAARNRQALVVDDKADPPMFKISDTHYAATWLLDPRAPKIEMPQELAHRIERLKKEAKDYGTKV